MKTVMQSMYSAVVIAFACFALLQKVQAVVPPPDGSYPNFTTAEGQSALLRLTTGAGNTAVGALSLEFVTTGSLNTALGAGTLVLNNADSNTAVGATALLLNTASGSTAVGASALQSNSTGPGNTAVGYHTLLANTTNGGSTATGYEALANCTGFGNTAVGYQALRTVTTGSNNTALGASAGIQIETESGNVCIGAGGVSTSLGENNITRIRNIGTTPIGAGINVVISNTGGLGDGALGYPSSSRRYKEEIKPVDKASEKLFALQPVSFRTKVNTGAANVKLYGLIAEDVATVDRDLVVFNAEGQPETLRFDSISAMLLNEFLKEHRKVQEQDATIAQLKQGMQLLTAQLKGQAAQIQKVSDRLELRKFATGRIRDGGPAHQAIANGQ
jgi:trimeric autotransporter adhesin